MKRIIVAIMNNTTDNFGIIPPSVQLWPDTEVLLHYSPRLTEGDSGLTANFDYLIDFCLEENRRFKRLLGDRYIPQIRESKSEQAALIKKLAIEHRLSLISPTVYSASGSAPMAVGLTYYGIPSGEKVVVKRENGARGCNQALVPTHQLNDFLVRLERPHAELKKMFPDVVFTEMYAASGESGKIGDDEPYFQNDRVMVCQYIDGIEAEYRLLVSADAIYVRQRERKDVGGYSHANEELLAPISGAGKQYQELNKCTDLSPAVTKELYALVKALDFRYGSMDVFVTADGHVGVFEYQHQFGFKNTDPAFILDLTLNYLRDLIGSCRSVPPIYAPFNILGGIMEMLSTEVVKQNADVDKIVAEVVCRIRKTMSASVEQQAIGVVYGQSR